LAIAIPIRELILIKCYFFLDTIFLGFYTFVNCKVSLAGSMSTRQRENRKNGNQESSSKEASEEGSQENSKEEVSRQRNRQHNRGTPKASPEVFLVEAISSVFMRSPSTLRPIGKFCGGCARRSSVACGFARWQPGAAISGCSFSRFRGWARCGVSPRAAAKIWEGSVAGGEHRGPCRRKARHRLPKWYWAMPPLDERVKR
jgi:hypothetical protein